jgi:hypothetical protein
VLGTAFEPVDVKRGGGMLLRVLFWGEGRSALIEVGRSVRQFGRRGGCDLLNIC